MTLVYSNFAEGTLAQAAGVADATIYLDATGAAKLPTVGSGLAARIVVWDGQSGTNPEIIEITARTGQACTVTRGKESTAATAWNAGSRWRHAPTAEGFNTVSLVAASINATSVSGTDTITATVLAPGAVLTDGMELFFTPVADNTGAVTITLTDGVLTTAAKSLKQLSGDALIPGQIKSGMRVKARYVLASDVFYYISKTGLVDYFESINDDGVNAPLNLFPNGDFNDWINGTNFATPASGTETSEYAYVAYDGAIGTFAVSQQAFTLGQTDVPGEPDYYLRWNQTVAGSGSSYRQLRFRIPRVKTFANEYGAASVYLQADAARTVTGQFYQVFGTGGSPSADVAIGAAATFNLTTTWTRFKLSALFTSLTGKTLGSNEDDSVELRLSLPVNTTMQVNVATIQGDRGRYNPKFARREGKNFSFDWMRGLSLGDMFTVAAGKFIRRFPVGADGSTLIASGVSPNTVPTWLAPGTLDYVLAMKGSPLRPTWSTPPPPVPGATSTTGNVTLTAASTGMQVVTCTAFGQYIKLPDATTMTKCAIAYRVQNVGGFPLQIRNSAGTILGFLNPGLTTDIGLLDISTAAGSWVVDTSETVSVIGVAAQTSVTLSGTTATTTSLYATVIDATRTCVFFNIGGTNTYAIVHDSSDDTFGTPVTVGTNVATSFNAALYSADKIVANYTYTGGNLVTTVMTFSGKTITVGTPVTTVLANNALLQGPPVMHSTTAMVIMYDIATAVTTYVQAITVSGTTPTIGTAVATTARSAGNFGSLFAIQTNTKVMATYDNGSASATHYFDHVSVSGTTITLTAGATIAHRNAQFRIMRLNDDRFLCVYGRSTGTQELEATIISFSGSTISENGSANTTLRALFMPGSSVVSVGLLQNAAGTKIAVVGQTDNTNAGPMKVALITNTTGTYSIGTIAQFFAPYKASSSTLVVVDLGMSSNTGYFFAADSDYMSHFSVDMSGSNPTVSILQQRSWANEISVSAGATDHVAPGSRAVWSDRTAGQFVRGGYPFNFNVGYRYAWTPNLNGISRVNTQALGVTNNLGSTGSGLSLYNTTNRPSDTLQYHLQIAQSAATSAILSAVKVAA